MNFVRRLTIGLAVGTLFFAAAIVVGVLAGKPVAAISVIGTSIVLEAQPASFASLPLRFHPFTGAVISILGNLILLPVLVLTLEEIIGRWAWVRRKLEKASKWSDKYGKYGVWVLVPLSPVFGAYVCIGIGYLMRWRPKLVLIAVIIGMIVSSFVITYGGESVAHVLRNYLHW